MNKKQIIQIVIIVGAFAAAGFVLYKGGLFGGGSHAAISQASLTATSTQADILPYGNSLDFTKVLDPNRFNYNQVQYQQVSPTTDVGLSPDSLISPDATQ